MRGALSPVLGGKVVLVPQGSISFKGIGHQYFIGLVAQKEIENGKEVNV